MTNTDDHNDILDVAIVGAGVSGVYSAWRLITELPHAGGPPHIAVFESSERVGGRLLSVSPPGVPKTLVELGGMRFISEHRRVQTLLRNFGIATAPFPVHEPQNLAYLRGHCLRMQDLATPEKLPYKFNLDECAPSTLAEGFTAFAARRLLRLLFGKDIDLANVDWPDVQRKRLDGKLLRDYPLRYVLQRFLSNEALRFADDSSGYDTILTQWNAADGLPWNLSDFGKDVTYFRVPGGFDVLPRKIAERFVAAGGTLCRHSRLTAFDEIPLDGGQQGVELRFARGGGAPAIVKARRLILAMPRRSIELLQPTGAVLGRMVTNDPVRRLIGSVTPIPLFKLALCYSYPWWQTLDPVQVGGGPPVRRITAGESITDLPVRQCYYWAVDAETQNAVILIYDDGTSSDYWAGLRDRTKSRSFKGDGPAEVDQPASAKWTRHPAPEPMVAEAHRQLLEMHGVAGRPDIPLPYAAAYRDWAEDPYGGGANFWNVHADSDQVARDILQPKPSVPVYICGEAYSHYQGWVEGALETADALLNSHWGLPQRVF